MVDQKSPQWTRFLTIKEARHLLSVIDVDSPWGRRDYTLILFSLITGRTIREVTRLRWGDFHVLGPCITYTYLPQRSPDGKPRTLPLATEVWDLIRAYLESLDKLESIQPDEYIFTPLTDVNGFLRRKYGPDWQNRPLQFESFRKALRNYVEFAGLDTHRVTHSSLHYTAAVWRVQAGASFIEIQRCLGHKSIYPTRLFIKNVQKQLASAGTPLHMSPGQRRSNMRPAPLVSNRPRVRRFPRRPAGFQSGNQVNLTHGFYSHHLEFDPEDLKLALIYSGGDFELAYQRVITLKIIAAPMKTGSFDEYVIRTKLLLRMTGRIQRIYQRKLDQHDPGWRQRLKLLSARRLREQADLAEFLRRFEESQKTKGEGHG